jgi:light-regulated signal transduction histidine kinase (bacteriophytochrome)
MSGAPSPEAVDRDVCAREPIRIPGGIQPHGVLVVLDPARMTVLQASANAADTLGLEPGASAADLIAPFAGHLSSLAPGGKPVSVPALTLPAGRFHVAAHRTGQGLLVEFERLDAEEAVLLDAVYPKLRDFLEAVTGDADILRLAGVAAREVAALTGFDRVMIYRFDADWNGTVVAEHRNGRLPSYLDLRFPASDIPAQARELYRSNRLRLIPDAGYRPVPVEPALSPVDGAPLDLSQAALRSVSPVHLDYMRNMGTPASLSISLLVGGELWGLISCHHHAPRRVGPPVRAACDVFGQVLAEKIAARLSLDAAAERIALRRIETEIVTLMARAPTYQEGLFQGVDALVGLTAADGAAVLADGVLKTAGVTPPREAILALAGRIVDRLSDGMLATDRLGELVPAAARHADRASGLLAVMISQIHPSFVFWFRREVVATVSWGGDPRKPVTAGPDARLHPRLSFEAWKEEVRGRSRPWTQAEVDCARDFRAAVLDFVLRRAEERAELTEELRRSNRELEAFSYSVSHDLRAPFRHIVGYSELLAAREKTLDATSRHYLDSIVQSAHSAGRLVDDLLHFSQLGRMSLAYTKVDVAKLVDEVRRTLRPDLDGRAVEWRIGPLPDAHGDPALIRQLLLNLVGNAVKYSRGRNPAVIEITGERNGGEAVYRIRDNGVGFDMAYVGKLFGVFQRLHRVEDFEGTGIGLALAKRVVERHGGSIAAEGAVDRGATFTVRLPAEASERHG